MLFYQRVTAVFFYLFSRVIVVSRAIRVKFVNRVNIFKLLKLASTLKRTHSSLPSLLVVNQGQPPLLLAVKLIQPPINQLLVMFQG